MTVPATRTSSETTETGDPAAVAGPRRERFPRAVKPRMFLIINPRATTVSGRLKKLVEYALRGRYEVEAVETEAPNHATELTRDAVAQGFELVVAFGGDGTINETVNGLAGSEVALSVLPGGCTNVVCRMLGVPTDIVDATEHLLALADWPDARAIDLGRVNHRWFVSSAGIGMDADTTRWVDERPRVKSHAGPFFFSVAGAATFGRYLHDAPVLAFEAQGRRAEGVSAVIQNSDPYTYFNDRPIRVCRGTQLDSGELCATVLRSARRRDMPVLTLRLLSGRDTESHAQAVGFSNLLAARATALPDAEGMDRRFPIQVDGDYIGDFDSAEFAIEPAALRVVT
jgi:diacylglycerol kinase family enzyme